MRLGCGLGLGAVLGPADDDRVEHLDQLAAGKIPKRLKRRVGAVRGRKLPGGQSGHHTSSLVRARTSNARLSTSICPSHKLMTGPRSKLTLGHRRCQSPQAQPSRGTWGYGQHKAEKSIRTSERRYLDRKST